MQLLNFDTNPPILTNHNITCHNSINGTVYDAPFEVESLGAAIEHCRSYICGRIPVGHRHAAAIITDVNGKLFVNNRKGEPCYGFLRKYKERSDRPNDPRPGDLPRDFPEGTPVVVGVPINDYGNEFSWEKNKKFLSFLYGEKSPYAKLFKDTEVIVVNDFVKGYVFKDLEFDSNLFAYFLKYTRGFLSSYCKTFGQCKATGLFKSDEECAIYVLCGGGTIGINLAYVKDLSYFVKGNVKYPTGTFKSGADYARPLIERMFSLNSPLDLTEKYRSFLNRGNLVLNKENIENVWRKEYEAALS